ncbi:MAG: hypothetical protein DMG76_17885 [Acidobacteria bacterium]|nr:MAG: hypothetical protein DMG76_17885 [Acidobacteriota bacterium]
MPIRQISFGDLSIADLIVDAIYKGGSANNAGDDPIAKLLPCGNQGGFRFCGSTTLPGCRMAVLFSTFNEPDWPDLLEPETGRFMYFGDNRQPGHELHEAWRQQIAQGVFRSAALRRAIATHSATLFCLLSRVRAQGRSVQGPCGSRS